MLPLHFAKRSPHHLLPISRGGPDSSRNILWMGQGTHFGLHHLVANARPDEQLVRIALAVEMKYFQMAFSKILVYEVLDRLDCGNFYQPDIARGLNGRVPELAKNAPWLSYSWGRKDVALHCQPASDLWMERYQDFFAFYNALSPHQRLQCLLDLNRKVLTPDCFRSLTNGIIHHLERGSLYRPVYLENNPDVISGDDVRRLQSLIRSRSHIVCPA